jgi:DNA-binding LacI/PurR family transcriptional regulator
MSTRVPPVHPRSRIKIVDVAREAGVSITTVSHALNGRGYVDPQTREAVKAIATRLGYRPNRVAQQLRSGRTNVIALMSSMPFAVAGGPSRMGFMMEIAAVTASVALTRGLALILVPPSEIGAPNLDDIGIDGALVIEPASGDMQLARLLQRGVPVVTIGKQPGGTDLSCVDLHSKATTTQLLKHLRAQGARRIALLTGAQERSPYTEAVSAYETFASERRMKPLVFRCDENLGEEAGRSATLAMLSQHPKIDAICAPVDAFAVGSVRALLELGRAIPGDVQIATRYDGLRARHCRPPLTALNLQLEAVATLAIELLMEAFDGNSTSRQVGGPKAELVPRESTAVASTAPCD